MGGALIFEDGVSLLSCFLVRSLEVPTSMFTPVVVGPESSVVRSMISADRRLRPEVVCVGGVGTWDAVADDKTVSRWDIAAIICVSIVSCWLWVSSNEASAGEIGMGSETVPGLAAARLWKACSI